MGNVRVYAIAFACEPGRGSEPGVGYAFAEGLARLSNELNYEIILLTRSHRIKQIASSIQNQIGSSSMQILDIKIPKALVAITKRRHVRAAYIYWQLMAVLKIRTLIRNSKQDVIVHHLSFATDALPTFEWLIPNKVYRIFGPAGSSQKLNSLGGGSLRMKLGRRVRAYFGRLNIRNVDLAIAQNDEVAVSFQRFGAVSVVVEPNVVVDNEMIGEVLHSPDGRCGNPSGIVSVGLLIDRKRHHLAIDALGRLSDKSLVLTIVGDGILLDQLSAYAESLGLADRVIFSGKQSRQATLRIISEAKVLVHPSRQEGAGWVVGEAQSLGTPPVVFRDSGADTLIDITGYGVVAEFDTVECLAEAITEAMKIDRQAIDRWSSERLPGILSRWYSNVQGH